MVFNIGDRYIRTYPLERAGEIRVIVKASNTRAYDKDNNNLSASFFLGRFKKLPSIINLQEVYNR